MNSFDPGTRRCCFVCCIVLTSWCRSQRDMRCRPMWCLREESGAWNKRQRCGKSGETSRKEWLSMRVVARFRSYVMIANWTGTKQQTGDKPIKIGVQLTISGNQTWRLLENNVFVSNKPSWRLWFPAHFRCSKRCGVINHQPAGEAMTCSHSCSATNQQPVLHCNWKSHH